VRVLAWDGCINVRDLGGLPFATGTETRYGVVVRADSIRGLTEEGWQAVLDYGVKLAIDLRSDDEVAEDANADAPIRVVRVPIDPWESATAYEWPSMFEGYVALLEHFQTRFARAIQELAAADASVVIHCQGGRDRTGLVVALVLQLVGVDAETIAADHARSDESWAPMIERWFEEAPTEQERERRRRITAPAGRTMVDVLGAVESRFGGARRFLIEGGAAGEDIDRLVLRFRP